MQVGKYADMITLNRDPFLNSNKDRINTIKVLQTILGGREIFRDNNFWLMILKYKGGRILLLFNCFSQFSSPHINLRITNLIFFHIYFARTSHFLILDSLYLTSHFIAPLRLRFVSPRSTLRAEWICNFYALAGSIMNHGRRFSRHIFKQARVLGKSRLERWEIFFVIYVQVQDRIGHLFLRFLFLLNALKEREGENQHTLG